MDTRYDLRPQAGMDVIDSNDHLVGTVETVEHDHFVVAQGIFFLHPHRIPCTAISDVRDNEIRLRITREAALHSSVDTHWADLPLHGEIVDTAGENSTTIS